MAQQTVPDKTAEKQYSLNYLLGIGSFFKDPNNRGQTYNDNWTFKKIEAVLHLCIVTFKPELKNASFEEILEALNQLTSEEQTQTTFPTSLLEQLEKGLDQTAEIKEEIKQKAAASKNKFIERLTKSPVSPEKKTAVVGSLSENLSESLGKSDLPVLSSKLKQTSPGTEENLQLKEQIQQNFLEIWKEAVAKTAEKNNLSTEESAFLSSLASPVLQIVKPIAQISQFENIAKFLSPAFSPEKAKSFSDEFFKSFPDNLARQGSNEEAIIYTLWQMVGSDIPLKPEEVAAVLNSLTSTSTSLPRPTVNPLHLKDEDGVTVFDRIKDQLLSGGININPENDKRLKSFRFQIQAIEAIYKGLKKQDLEAKINQLLKTGLSESSPEITELRGVATAHEELLQKAREFGFSEKQIDRWQKQALFPQGKIQLPFFSNIKSWFLNTSFGKPIKFALEKSAQKSLQSLWTAGREGIKKVAIPALTKLLTTILGIGAKAAVIAATNIVGVVLLALPIIIGAVKNLFKKIFSSGTRLFSSMFSGIMGTTDIPEDSDSKWLKWIFIGIFAFIFFLGVFDMNVKSGAFINERAELSEPSFTSPGLPSQCQPSRHFAEEVICVLKACNISKITTSTADSVKQCIENSSLTGKTALVSNLTALYDGVLQCIGFVDAIQEALGKSMGQRRNACQYYVSPPIGYTLIEGTENPQVGDVAVWNEAGCGGGSKSTAAYWGHIAIVVEINGNRKLTVAEANGMNGILRIVEYSYGHPENSTDPTGFLRQ